jgi:hypothetical protein
MEYRAHRRRLSSGKFRRIESAVPAPEAHADAAPVDRPRWSQSQEVVNVIGDAPVYVALPLFARSASHSLACVAPRRAAG